MRKQSVSLKALRCYADGFLCCGAQIRCKYPNLPCDYHRFSRRQFGSARPLPQPDDTGAGPAPEPEHENKSNNGHAAWRPSPTWGSANWGPGSKFKKHTGLTEEEQKLRNSIGTNTGNNGNNGGVETNSPATSAASAGPTVKREPGLTVSGDSKSQGSAVSASENTREHTGVTSGASSMWTSSIRQVGANSKDNHKFEDDRSNTQASLAGNNGERGGATNISASTLPSQRWGSAAWGSGSKSKNEFQLTGHERKQRESIIADQAADQENRGNFTTRGSAFQDLGPNFSRSNSRPIASRRGDWNKQDQHGTTTAGSQSPEQVGHGPLNDVSMPVETSNYQLHGKYGYITRYSNSRPPQFESPSTRKPDREPWRSSRSPNLRTGTPFSENRADGSPFHQTDTQTSFARPGRQSRPHQIADSNQLSYRAGPFKTREQSDGKGRTSEAFNSMMPSGWGTPQSSSDQSGHYSAVSGSPSRHSRRELNQHSNYKATAQEISDGPAKAESGPAWSETPFRRRFGASSERNFPRFRWISPSVPAQEPSQPKPVNPEQPPLEGFEEYQLETPESRNEAPAQFRPEAYQSPSFPNFRRFDDVSGPRPANEYRITASSNPRISGSAKDRVDFSQKDRIDLSKPKNTLASIEEWDGEDDTFDGVDGQISRGSLANSDEQTRQVSPMDKKLRKQSKHKKKFASGEDEDWEGGKDDLDDFDIEAKSPRRGKRKAKRKVDKPQETASSGPTPIYLPEFITVSNLADALSQRKPNFLRRIQELGFEEATYDHVLDAETAGLIAAEFNFEALADASANDLVAAPPPEDASVLAPRPPVVTIMGHVDHGKTTILDWLRKSSVAASEHGGITQHIGAFSVKMPSGKLITFLDTPGHAAFLDMRRRGADVTDIVILVVAADDSVKPQTLEAIKHANDANVPIIVAMSKIDKPDINVEKVKQDLARHNVNIEDFGGDVQTVGVSGKTGKGMRELEEATVTLSEMLELRADPTGSAEGWVIEAATVKGGRVATVLVRRGILRPGNVVVAGKTWARIRNLRNEAGVNVQEATPGTPVAIDGWKELPTAGDEVLQAESEQRAKEVVEQRQEKEETQKMGGDMQAINEARRTQREKRQAALTSEEEGILSEAAAASEQTDSKITIPLIVKADVSGSVEAVVNFIASIGTNEIYPTILRASAGKVTEFDVKHAAVAKGMILTFNEPTDPEISKLARAEGVEIVDHTIIYELIDDVKTRLGDKLAPKVTQRVLGEADIAQIFEISLKRREKTAIAGCKITNGLIGRSHKVKVFRDNEVIYDGTLSSLKNVKKDVTEMRKGTECGIGFDNWTDFQVGDQIQTYEEVQEKRTL